MGIPNSSHLNQKRAGIIVGINSYENIDKIQELSGAENDAIELRDKLTMHGDFEIDSSHFLIGKNATCRAIRTALSDLFRKQISLDLAVVYFSGHGVIDENNEGYIAPHDMDPNDPFISGIEMAELRRVINENKNVQSVLVILDCCYAGILADDEHSKTGSDVMTKNIYQLQVKSIAKSSDTATEGKGRIILASSEADRSSREKDNCIHGDSKEAHSHGAFSYHLIEGLEGAAADEKGLITVQGIRKYLENMMIYEEKKQIPIYSVHGGTEIENIRICKSEAKFDAEVMNILSRIHSMLDNDTVLYLINASKKTYELQRLDPNNHEIPALVNTIDERSSKLKTALTDWLTVNEIALTPTVDSLNRDLYSKFYTLANLIGFENFKTIRDNQTLWLSALCSEMGTQNKYGSEDAAMVEPFLRRIRSINKMGSII